jgi:hypothetical protein
MNTQDSSNRVLVDFNAESQRNLLSNSWTTPVPIAAFHCNDRVDQFLTWSFRARLLLLLRRGQETVLVLCQQMVEVQQGGRPQDDTRAENASRAHENSTQTGKDTICSTQVGSAPSASVEDQQLMTEQDGFGQEGTDSARPGHSDQGDDQMNEKKENVAHLWIIAKPPETPRFSPILVIRHPQD